MDWIIAFGIAAAGFGLGFAAHRRLVRRALGIDGLAAAWRASVLHQALVEVRSASTISQAADRVINLIPPEHR